MRLGCIIFVGKSGEDYSFECWNLETRFRALGAVYAVTRRRAEGSGYNRAHHETLYIGEVASLACPADGRSRFAPYVAHGANCVCVYAVSTEERRIAIRNDLVAAHEPILNRSDGRAGWAIEPIITAGKDASAQRRPLATARMTPPAK